MFYVLIINKLKLYIILMKDTTTSTQPSTQPTSTQPTMSSSQAGYLEIILGPMWSGKTSALLKIYRQYSFCKSKICVINYEADIRYSRTMLSTHDKEMIPCILGVSMEEIMKNHKDEIETSNVILINEGQFFSDIVPFTIKMVEEERKKVYICGLDGDFKRDKIGNLLDLIPMCDKMTKLHALCSMCKDGTLAPFTFRSTCETEQVLIGNDIYVPLCRSCFNLQTKHKMEEERGVSL
jgi:thymidine kinase